MVEERVLGIDLGPGAWANNGSALVGFDRVTATISSVAPAVIAWPSSTPLTPLALADVIDSFARSKNVRAVSIDGPQGWRDPSTDPSLPGVGRRCEYEARTPGRTGAHPRTYPSSQSGWISFSIALFEELLRRPGVLLAEEITEEVPMGGYLLLECFPTSTWRFSGLRPLPGKARRPPLPPYVADLTAAYSLPPLTVTSHDDLQAVVAALPAVGVLNGPVTVRRRGVASSIVNGLRVEGVIWEACPRGGPVLMSLSPGGAPPSPPPPTTGKGHVATACVTPGVLRQVMQHGDNHMMIALAGIPSGTKAAPRRVEIVVDDEAYILVVGDSHGAWRSHQDQASAEHFEMLFAMLANRPGERVPISDWRELP